MKVRENPADGYYAKNFRELRVYKAARSLAKDIYETTRKFPAEERYSLTSQIRRSSRSIGAQIAESWGKRVYRAHFVSKLTDADGEQYETQHWLEVAYDCGYLDKVQRDGLIVKCAEIGRMLHGMIAKADYFCQSAVKEARSDYSL